MRLEKISLQRNSNSVSVEVLLAGERVINLKTASRLVNVELYSVGLPMGARIVANDVRQNAAPTEGEIGVAVILFGLKLVTNPDQVSLD